MTKKLVKYNGETMSFYGCSDPRVLKKGQLYEVEKILKSGYHTEYVLKGIRGEFNSVWFDTVETVEEENIVNVYTALSHEKPIIGKRYNCYKISFIDGKPSLQGWSTSPVKNINYLGNNIYGVTTQNSLYIVTVG